MKKQKSPSDVKAIAITKALNKALKKPNKTNIYTLQERWLDYTDELLQEAIAQHIMMDEEEVQRAPVNPPKGMYN